MFSSSSVRPSNQPCSVWAWWGTTEIAQAAGVGRTNLYKALSPEGNPEFATVAKILKALGPRLTIAA